MAKEKMSDEERKQRDRERQREKRARQKAEKEAGVMGLTAEPMPAEISAKTEQAIETPAGPETKPAWNPTPNQAARSSAAAAEKMADPANVAELHALAGKLYTLDEIAAAFGVTTRAVQLYVKSGKLRGVKIGGSWRVSASNFKKFIEGD